MEPETTQTPKGTKNFLEEIIEADLASGRAEGVLTRFPPEPNGYLHIGHAKSICLNFGLAEKYRGGCNLRFDDTNPAKEEEEYMEAIREDVRWLGFSWADLRYASDYFDRFREWALVLIRAGKAYVDDQAPEEIRTNRGTLTRSGVDSPCRNRSVEENLDLFGRMERGEFDEGTCVLRAKIDMGHPNMNMRDPVLYRILKRPHYRTGDRWCIYPMYDFAHGYEDAEEGVTHSICTLEFEDHRPLYDWFLDNVPVPHRPRQYEFARLGLTYTVMSKRLLLDLVRRSLVSGWDDPRMPTIRGIRRRGYTPSSIRRFIDLVGVSKANSLVEMELLEHCIREELNVSAPRAMAVLRPLKLTVESWPEGVSDPVEVPVNPEDPASGTRAIPFGREIWIERDDFMENPPSKFFRLAPGREVRLKGAYLVTCREVRKDSEGNVTELRCVHDPDSRGGEAPDGRRIKGTLHWVPVAEGVPAEVRLYDRLFTLRDMGQMAEGKSYEDYLNPNSLETLSAMVEPRLAEAAPGERFQFLRQGYFVADPDGRPGRPVFSRIVSLKDSWGKARAKGGE
jgi:glutaminyl-tRNA synthetase